MGGLITKEIDDPLTTNPSATRPTFRTSASYNPGDLPRIVRHVGALRWLCGERRSLRDDGAGDLSSDDHERCHDVDHARHHDDAEAQPLNDDRPEVDADNLGHPIDDADHGAHRHADDREEGHADDCLHSPDDRTGHDDDGVCVDAIRARDVLLGR